MSLPINSKKWYWEVRSFGLFGSHRIYHQGACDSKAMAFLKARFWAFYADWIEIATPLGVLWTIKKNKIT